MIDDNHLQYFLIVLEHLECKSQSRFQYQMFQFSTFCIIWLSNRLYGHVLIYSSPRPRSYSLLNFEEIRKHWEYYVQYHVKTSFTHYETYKCTYLAYETTLSVILSLHLYIL